MVWARDPERVAADKGTTAMTSKHLALTAATLLALAAPAFASDGDQGPYPAEVRTQAFALSTPRLDLGSEAYLTTTGLGAGEEGRRTNGVIRNGVPAYQHGFDTGSETPVVR